MRYARRLLAACAFLAFAAPAARSASLAHPDQAGMRLLADRVYVDPALPRDEAARLPALIEEARERVRRVYGEARARPNIVFCASDDCYRGFGAIGLGFTDGTHLVISPRGRRAAILAHELAHVELAARLGGFERLLALVPQWFDEGQAVMVSRAEEFSEAAWRSATRNGRSAPPLRAIASMDDWARLTGRNGENMQLTYGTACHEVRRWFERAGHEGFDALLRALREDLPFDEAYARTETLHTPDVGVAAAPEAGGRFARAAW